MRDLLSSVESVDPTYETQGKELLSRFFVAHPEAKDLFAFTKTANEDDGPMRRTGAYVFKMFPQFLSLVEKNEFDDIKSFGLKYPQQASSFKLMESTFVDLVEEYSGEDLTAGQRKAFKNAFGQISAIMLNE